MEVFDEKGEAQPLHLASQIPVSDDSGAHCGSLDVKIIARAGDMSMLKQTLKAASSKSATTTKSPGSRKPKKRIGTGIRIRSPKQKRTAPSPKTDARQTSLELPSMLSSFQLNEVVAANDDAGILPETPKAMTVFFQPGATAPAAPSNVRTSWSNARPVFMSSKDAFENENGKEQEQEQDGGDKPLRGDLNGVREQTLANAQQRDGVATRSEKVTIDPVRLGSKANKRDRRCKRFPGGDGIPF